MVFKRNFTSYEVATFEKNISMQRKFVVNSQTMLRWIFNIIFDTEFCKKNTAHIMLS